MLAYVSLALGVFPVAIVLLFILDDSIRVPIGVVVVPDVLTLWWFLPVHSGLSRPPRVLAAEA